MENSTVRTKFGIPKGLIKAWAYLTLELLLLELLTLTLELLLLETVNELQNKPYLVPVIRILHPGGAF